MKTKNSFFLFLFCSIIFSGHFAYAVGFSSADLEGEWRGYFLESWINPANGDTGAADLVYLLKMEPDFPWPMFSPAVTNPKKN